MMAEQITGLGSALTCFLGGFRKCPWECRLVEQFATNCRGMVSNYQRKSVERMALAAANTVRESQGNGGGHLASVQFHVEFFIILERDPSRLVDANAILGVGFLFG
jgi:hypothetical protein